MCVTYDGGLPLTMYFLPRSLTQKLVKPLVVGDLGLKLDRSSRAPFVPQCAPYIMHSDHVTHKTHIINDDLSCTANQKLVRPAKDGGSSKSIKQKNGLNQWSCHNIDIYVKQYSVARKVTNLSFLLNLFLSQDVVRAFDHSSVVVPLATHKQRCYVHTACYYQLFCSTFISAIIQL